MICALAGIAVGVIVEGHVLYNACIYRCPTGFYYHYPYVIKIPYNFRCPPAVKVGKGA
jgi:hypothetical protein